MKEEEIELKKHTQMILRDKFCCTKCGTTADNAIITVAKFPQKDGSIVEKLICIGCLEDLQKRKGSLEKMGLPPLMQEAHKENYQYRIINQKMRLAMEALKGIFNEELDQQEKELLLECVKVHKAETINEVILALSDEVIKRELDGTRETLDLHTCIEHMTDVCDKLVYRKSHPYMAAVEKILKVGEEKYGSSPPLAVHTQLKTIMEIRYEETGTKIYIDDCIKAIEKKKDWSEFTKALIAAKRTI